VRWGAWRAVLLCTRKVGGCGQIDLCCGDEIDARAARRWVSIRYGC
jgi:hypothetical protein